MVKYISVLILLLFINSNIKACTCSGLKPFAESFNQTEHVIHVKVLSSKMMYYVPKEWNNEKPKYVENIDLSSIEENFDIELYETYPYSKLVVEAEVIEVFKGKLKSKMITIVTNTTSSNCGYTSFLHGGNFVAYLYKLKKREGIKTKNVFTTNSCTRTTKYCDDEILKTREYLKMGKN